MIEPIAPRMQVATPARALSKEDTDLKKVAGQLQGVFVQQLFKAMRDTVPQQEGIVSGGSGEDIFTSLMDEHLAAETPNHWEGGIGEALFRQLRTLNGSTAAPASPTHTDSSAN